MMLVNNGTIFNSLNNFNQTIYQQPIALDQRTNLYKNGINVFDRFAFLSDDDDEIRQNEQLLKMLKLPLSNSSFNSPSNREHDSRSISKNSIYSNLNNDKLNFNLDNDKSNKNSRQFYRKHNFNVHNLLGHSSSSIQPSRSFVSSITSARFKSKSLKSSTPFESSHSTRSLVSSLSKSDRPFSQQLTSSIDLFNSTKLPIKSILSSKNETLFNHQSSQNANSTLKSSTPVYELVYPPYIQITATIICLIIFVLGVLGNILVSLIIFRSKELRNTTNYFLVNLSIADLLVIIVCMPTVLIELHSKPEVWLLGEFMCKTIPYVEISVAHVSILTMLAISFERFYAICKPLKVSYKCTKLRAVLIILCIWIISLITTLPLLFIAKQDSATYLDGSEVQVCLTQANSALSKSFFLIIIALFFFLPLIILVIIYIRISKKLCTKENISYAESVQMRARRQVVIMLASVIVTFFICLLPFRLFTLFLLFVNSNTLDSLGMEQYYVYLYTSRVMLYLNSALNPILYNLISSKFRNAFVQILCCRNLSTGNRMLIRQNTFNTTTTTISLAGYSSLNGFLNNTGNSTELINTLNKSSRSSINCLIKQSYSVDTNLSNNLKQLNFKNKGRQASLQLTSASNADENANEIDFASLNAKRLVKQASVNSDYTDRADLVRSGRNSAEMNQKPETSNSNKKQLYTISNNSNVELKVANLPNDLNLNEKSLDGSKKDEKKLSFKKLFHLKSKDDKLKESIIEEDSTKIVQKCKNNESSKESNV